ATVPAFPLMVLAAPAAPILIDDPEGNTSMEVFPGASINVNTGDAIRVNNQGNSIFVNGITVTAEADARGAHATVPAFPLMVLAAPAAPILIDDPEGNTSMEVFP
ncbi:hypothetical protein CTI14_58750, partial [Methylobacterium radiotolerans]